jgi:hypothetical protein
MSKQTALQQFLSLVQQVRAGRSSRSENDISSKLALVLSDLGLHTVIDTSVSSGGRKRPDILAYASKPDADLVLAAELVIESKKPKEVEEFCDLSEAIVSDKFWHSKTYPYLRDNISRIQYFAFTSFSEFAVFHVTNSIRAALIDSFRSKEIECTQLRMTIRNETIVFRLIEAGGSENNSAAAWTHWIDRHFRPELMVPIPLTSTRNSIPVVTTKDLEQLAASLATFAAGSKDPVVSTAGLFLSIRRRLSQSYSTLDPAIRRDLLIFHMSQHPGLNTQQAEQLVREDVSKAIDDFVAASIHSLLSRFFAVKVIEDVFCIGVEQPLIEENLWLFSTAIYDNLQPEDIRTEVFQRIRQLSHSNNPVVQRLAGYGFFFDWIETYIDPVVFRALLETFGIHDFTHVEGDLLGRFYELYAQQINSGRRKELGQYYTPMAIVLFMWRQAIQLVRERGEINQVSVLDPAMGSATFLTEGAHLLGEAGISKFWERLVGFDISPQVLGIAHVNLYMAILAELSRDEVLDVANLRLYATDALDYERGSHLSELLPIIVNEELRIFLQQRVAITIEAKQQSSYRVIIGNPPYRNNSNLTLNQVASRFPRLLQTSVEQSGAQQRNIRDDYAWFIAAADYYLEDRGIICFILSDSFASRLSYEHLRAELLRYYRVHMLVRLGNSIFLDVGYRTSFAIILLEKRLQPLASPGHTEPIPYYDLRSLTTNVPIGQLGTSDDPRIVHLRDVARGATDLVFTARHTPSAKTRFSFYPSAHATARFGTDLVPLHEKNGRRLFVSHWPGIITAYDVLFKGMTREELEERLLSLFELCHDRSLSPLDLGMHLEQWGRERDFTVKELSTLKLIANQIRQFALTYDAEKIRRSFSGSIPREARWYPPAEHVHYLYYEPKLSVPRNSNPGKAVGWGTMNQWREPLSHEITPKLIYTTASTSKNGYAAFVTDDEWYVKLHGGTSQQFNYVGIHDPTKPENMESTPNNLTEDGVQLLAAITEAGEKRDALLHYVAGIWNSELAADLLEETGSNNRPGIRIPQNTSERELVVKIAQYSRMARDFARLRFHLSAGHREILTTTTEHWIDKALLEDVGFQLSVEESSRFRERRAYVAPYNANDLILARIAAIETQINSLVDLLYP